MTTYVEATLTAPTLASLTTLVHALLPRKLYRAGVGINFVRQVMDAGWYFERLPCRTHMICTKRPDDDVYELTLVAAHGWQIDDLIDRLDRPARQLSAILRSRILRDKRRSTRSSKRFLRSVGIKPQQPVVGNAHKRLRRHFKHTNLTYGDVLRAIVFATGRNSKVVQSRLHQSIQSSGSGVLYVGGFAIRVDAEGSFPNFIPSDTVVTLSTTDDSNAKIYRRLREYLRRELGADMSRRQREARTVVEQKRMHRKMQKRKAAAA